MNEPIDWTQVWIEWDEPGAGGIYAGSNRIVNFSLDTGWVDPWKPTVDPVGLAFMDLLPRLVQEREMAYDCAKRWEAIAKNLEAGEAGMT